MSTHDLQGREYVRLSELEIGSKVECDGDFTCIDKGSILEIKKNKYGLYIDCNEGGHNIDGQLSCKDEDHLVGLYPVKE